MGQGLELHVLEAFLGRVLHEARSRHRIRVLPRAAAAHHVSHARTHNAAPAAPVSEIRREGTLARICCYGSRAACSGGRGARGVKEQGGGGRQAEQPWALPSQLHSRSCIPTFPPADIYAPRLFLLRAPTTGPRHPPPVEDWGGEGAGGEG